VEYGEEELVLTAEHPHHVRLRDPGGPGDRVGGRPRVAAPSEFRSRRDEDLAAPLRARHARGGGPLFCGGGAGSGHVDRLSVDAYRDPHLVIIRCVQRSAARWRPPCPPSISAAQCRLGPTIRPPPRPRGPMNRPGREGRPWGCVDVRRCGWCCWPCRCRCSWPPSTTW